MDLGVFSGARAADVRFVCPRRQWKKPGLVGASDGGNWGRGLFCPAPRCRTAALYPSLYRGQAQSPVPQDLLHLRLERCHYLHPAEPGGTGDCRCDREMGDEADLSTSLLPPSCTCTDTGCPWPAAASWTFDRGRGDRATILLRCGVDSGDFADCPVVAVEDATPVGSDGPAQTGSLCSEPVRC